MDIGKRNAAMQLAKEFRKFKALEDDRGYAGDIPAAEEYMRKKWAVAKTAEEHGIGKEFTEALEELGI